MKKDEMNGAYDMYGKEEKLIKCFGGKIWKKNVT
jgi:hypothetical protein